jgi:formate dehydrogenase subunit gamma
MTTHDHDVLRYRRNQRIVHAMLASSFVLLLLTGIFIVWPPASFLAAGGYTRILHRIAAVVFMAVPVAYLIMDRRGAIELVVESFHYDRDDFRWLRQMYRYAAGHTREMPPQGRLNAGQKIHHAAVIVISAGVVGSGLILWWFKSSLGAGMLAWTAMIHDVSMLALTLLLIGHLFFTFTYDALSGMTSGYVPEEEARLEHAKWVDSLARAGSTTEDDS